MNKGLDLFWYWVNERHRIWVNRVTKKRLSPWTKDDILQRFHFTNVFRELDRGTIFMEKILKDCDPKYIVLNILLYRCFNKIETAQALKLPVQGWKARERTKVAETIRQLRNPFTGAHLQLYSMGRWLDCVEYWWRNRHEYTDLIETENTVATAYKLFRNLPSTGPFFAHQFAQDLRGTSILQDPSDGKTFSVPGPGSTRCMIRVLDESPTLETMQKITKDQRRRKRHVPKLEVKDVQQSLCEVWKYWKLQRSSNAKMRQYKGAKDGRCNDLYPDTWKNRQSTDVF